MQVEAEAATYGNQVTESKSFLRRLSTAAKHLAVSTDKTEME